MSKPKILYVDDDSINLLLFEANLEKKYTVLTANSVQSGLDILSNNPDIKVLMSDLKLPVMNGLEFISKAKQVLPGICCYILTGFDVSSEIRDAIKNGTILKYFQKPFNMYEIEKELQSVTAN